MRSVLQESRSADRREPVPLSSVSLGYLLLVLMQLIASPYLISNGVRRVLFGRHRGVGVRRFFGGVSPKIKGCIIIVGNAMGESRTALRAARAMRDSKGQRVAVWVEQIPVRDALRSQDPSVFVGLSPFNNPFSALIAMVRARPKAVIFVESARYLHIAYFARLFGAKTLVANVNISEQRKQEQSSKPTGSFRYRLIGAVSVQSTLQLHRILELGVPASIVTVTGPAIFEKVNESDFERAVEKWKRLLNLKSDDVPIVVAGSTHASEEPTLIRAFLDFRRSHRDALFVLAPRYLSRRGGPESEVVTAGVSYTLRSDLPGNIAESGIILLDTQGELREAYAIATVAFVGGSLIPEIGGHSPIEPLLWGTPVTMGPNYSQQEPAVTACLRAEVLAVCADAEGLTTAWLDAAKANGRRKQFIERAQDMLEEHRDVFDRWYEALFGPEMLVNVSPFSGHSSVR